MYLCAKDKNGIMNNSDFWVSINTVISEGFTPEGLIKLDRYAEQLISGQLIYKRFSPLEQHGCSAGGSCHVIASLLAGAETETDYGIEGINDFKRELQRGAQQALKIEKWAKSVGVWIDDVEHYLQNSLGEEIPEIYLSDMHDENVIKSDAGTFFVVDCDIRINTPELKHGGIRNLTTEVEFF